MALRTTVKTVAQIIDPKRMDVCVRSLNNYERYQASQGFRDAAEWVRSYLESEGIPAGVKSYPAEAGRFYETMPSPYEWVCRGAWCELFDDGSRRIADYAAHRNSVFEGSGACPEMKEPVEFVRVDNEDESAWTGTDFTGKVVFLDGMRPNSVRWLFENRGATGFVCVSRPVTDRPDAMYWSGIREPFWEPFFGFSVSPGEAGRIREHFEQLEKEGRKPRVRCFADTERREGSFELVTALIPGRTDKEILIVAHMCHPQNSCNDNLSGTAAAVETFRALNLLLKRGMLPPLRQGIRLLLVPEMLGSYAYIGERKSRGDLGKILAGINLDMVGASQDGHNGTLNLNEPPHSLPSFVGGLGKAVLAELRKDAYGMTKTDVVPVFNSFMTEYHGGSDHAQWTDPLVGVPMPMLNQLPDRLYHTDADLPETLDPFILWKSATLAAAFVYTLAALSVSDLPVIMQNVSELLVNRLGKVGEAFAAGGYGPKFYAHMAAQYTEYYLGTCGDYERFFDGAERDDVRKIAEEERERLRQIANLTHGRVVEAAYGDPAANQDRRENADGRIPFDTILKELADEKYDAVPVREFLGQAYYIADDGEEIAATAEGGAERYKAFKEQFDARGDDGMPNPSQHLIVYYINGRNTLREIIRRVILENHGYGDPHLMYEFITLLKDLQLVRFL
ncbi:MAG: DUF4910 domain-containing protein [Clostridiales Family XIII bacterium]|jgi:aminopeptidase-like protein|nr:DUF4910 domain-containing protein [Clostridiales Family XIII bacterium]